MTAGHLSADASESEDETQWTEREADNLKDVKDMSILATDDGSENVVDDGESDDDDTPQVKGLPQLTTVQDKDLPQLDTAQDKNLPQIDPVLAMLFRQDRFLAPARSIRELQQHEVVRGWPQTVVHVRPEGIPWVQQLLSA